MKKKIYINKKIYIYIYYMYFETDKKKIFKKEKSLYTERENARTKIFWVKIGKGRY